MASPMAIDIFCYEKDSAFLTGCMIVCKKELIPRKDFPRWGAADYLNRENQDSSFHFYRVWSVIQLPSSTRWGVLDVYKFHLIAHLLVDHQKKVLFHIWILICWRLAATRNQYPLPLHNSDGRRCRVWRITAWKFPVVAAAGWCLCWNSRTYRHVSIWFHQSWFILYT